MLSNPSYIPFSVEQIIKDSASQDVSLKVINLLNQYSDLDKHYRPPIDPIELSKAVTDGFNSIIKFYRNHSQMSILACKHELILRLIEEGLDKNRGKLTPEVLRDILVEARKTELPAPTIPAHSDTEITIPF